MDEKSAILSFSLSPIGPKGFRNLMEVYGSAKASWEQSDRESYKRAGIGDSFFEKFTIFRKVFDPAEYFDKLRRAKVEYISSSEKHYPEGLTKIPDAPIGLFIKGEKELLNKANLGVVGTRKITSYGRQVTQEIVEEVAGHGLIITSGMAMGVDGEAHLSAIRAGGATIAVLGCGVDCPYPRENERLYQEIIDSGGLVISEYPLGMRANKGTFPARNRIIAAISLGILVIEAGEGSGSLITAGLAARYGKPVFAVPGPITSQVSKGSLKLLREGAILIASGEDVIRGLNYKGRARGTFDKKLSQRLNRTEKKIVESLGREGLTLDELSKITKVKASALSIIVSELELKGLIKNSSGIVRLE